MKRLLMTGADGFTGRYLSRHLASAGYEVHGQAHRMPAATVEGALSIHACDLTDTAGLAALVAHIQPQYVVHLAGISFVADGDANAIYQINLLGTRHLLEALAALPRAPDSVLLASSANVYGNAKEGVLDETTEPAPANDYAVSKLAMEHMAWLYANRLPLIICRPFNYTGIGQAPSFLLPKIVDHVRRGATVIELGNLDVARDFSDVRVVVEAYRRLLTNASAVGGTFNICSGRAYSLREILAMTRDVSGHSLHVQVNPALIRQNEVKQLLGSRSRLDACIGVVPQIELESTLRWMLEAPVTENPSIAG